jgi:muconate cycloisomerase
MRITTIETFAVRFPLKPRWQATAPPGHEQGAEFVIVRIATDTGLEGVGEASGTPRWSGETAFGTKALIDRILMPRLLGADLHDAAGIDRRMDQVCKHNPFAKAGIEMACWDVRGKAAGKPVFALLGGSGRTLSVRTRYSIAGVPAAQAASLAEEAAAEGFGTVRVKVGGDPASDLERVQAVRRAIGDDCELVVDAVGGWDAETAIACIRALADCKVAWVEQPTVAGDYTAMARVKAQTGAHIVADDGVFTFVEARELIEFGCCEAFSLYPGKNGGIRKARQIADLAATHGLRCTIGSNGETDIGTAAAAHLCIGSQAFDLDALPGDLRGPKAFEIPVVTDPLRIEGATTTLRNAPGLGVDVDWATVRRHALSP